MGKHLTLLVIMAGGVGELSCSGGAATASGFVDQYCDALAPCCAMANLPSNGTQCRAFLGAFASSSSYNRTAGEACLAELHAAAGTPDFCRGGGSTGGDACDAVFSSSSGSKKPGETCTDDGDCASSPEGKVDCRLIFNTTGAETRKCQLQIRGKDGDNPCLGTVDGNITSYSSSGSSSEILPRGYLCHVADGLRCDSATAACVKLKAAGETCSGGSSECVKTAYCDIATRKCADRKPIGAACTSASQCADGTTCGDAPTRVCMTQLADGAACTQSAQCRSGRCLNGACDAGGGTDLGLGLICGSK